MEQDQTEITNSEKYKWNLKDLYANIEDWRNSKNNLEKRIDSILEFKDKLGNAADNLYQCLNLYSLLEIEYSKLFSYANQLSDQDTRESLPLAMCQEIDQIGVKLNVAASFIDPEIITIDSAVIGGYLKENENLKDYIHYIDNVRRLKPNTRNTVEEKIVSQAGLMKETAADIYSIFKNSDMLRPMLKLVDGRSVLLDDSTFTLYRSDSNREFRKSVFTEYYTAYKKYERTFGAQLYGQLKKNVFEKNVRNYNSCLESALNANNIPCEVYKNLINCVHDNLSVLHRYLRLRKKILGLAEMHYYDLYAPLVKKADKTYTIDEARNLVVKALAPLGSDYLETINQAFDNRWIDVYAGTGKTPGGYSTDSYDVHPYILMNYKGKYEDVSTLAHELGHAMHSHYSSKNQSFFNAQYPIFLAEVASINNEALLAEEAARESDNPEERLAILVHQLETCRTTLFRQTQFAEFELRIHELAEEGKPLTGQDLSELYLDILKVYYGHDKGIVMIDDLDGIEWASIPHLYYDFYVFQYATSYCAAADISEKIINGEEGMREKYIREFLSSGGSNYAIPTLQRLGIDMTAAAPYDSAFKKMNSLMDETEKILAENLGQSV